MEAGSESGRPVNETITVFLYSIPQNQKPWKHGFSGGRNR
jgi:hypothetical protein